ncbi:MAG: hypothetical protein IKM76_00255 [Prevotella sp.]|nr:hypothetical protein [Prevotella sp.]
MAATVNGAWAQGGTNSPYSQFGIGALSDQSQSMSRGMNGVGYGLRQGNIVNTLNPASYSGVDSLTMLFDMGVSGQFTHYEEGKLRRNASLASFEYVVGSFRAWKNVGVSFGLLPYSSVGYEYATSSRDQNLGQLTESFTGSGGLHEVFLGFGWRLLKPLSIGVNAGYLWGSIDRSVLPDADATANSLRKNYSTSVSNYKLDIGAQWVQPIGRFDRLTLGAVVGLGHNLKNDAEMTIVSTNQLSNSSDTTALKLTDAFELPMSFGVGAAYQHAGKLTLAADFTLDKWGDVKFPTFTGNEYKLQRGLLKDRMKMSVGLDWLPNPSQMGGRFLEHVHYRLGAGYATPYYYINGKEGPKELSVSAGFGIPIVNMHNNRSVLNISGQWVRSSATDFLTENYFRINIGVTFNERWFMKWKVD